jgi:hypothetical protein
MLSRRKVHRCSLKAAGSRLDHLVIIRKDDDSET